MSGIKWVVRATAQIKEVDGKKPGQVHGFQVCKLLDPDGDYEKFEMYFDASKNSSALEPGDYELADSTVKVKDGKLVIYPEYRLIKAEAKKVA